MKKVIGALVIFSCSLGAMDHDGKAEDLNGGTGADGTVQVDKAFIVQMREQGFAAFLQTKKGQRGTLKTVTGLPFGLGRAASSLLEQLGLVENTEHAITFLDRMFENEGVFQGMVEKLEEDDANIAYLQAVFARLNKETVSKEELVQAMRAERHELVPNPEKMGEKDGDDYVLPDDHFHKWAACNCLVFHWHEQQQDRRLPRGLRRRNSGGGSKSQKKE